jgi:hypothetical protein
VETGCINDASWRLRAHMDRRLMSHVFYTRMSSSSFRFETMPYLEDRQEAVYSKANPVETFAKSLKRAKHLPQLAR